MSTPPIAGGPGPRFKGLNFTGLQFLIFAGAGLVALAALLGAGLGLGLALAGATMVAALALVVWVIAANVIGSGAARKR